jgi:hypothetical protein
MMGGVGVSLDHGREKRSKTCSTRWTDSRARDPSLWMNKGSPGESFGDLMVEFERSPLAVRIIRDRSQWMADLAPGCGEFVPLHVLVTAWEGRTPAPQDRQVGDPLAEVLPEGVQWRVVLPGIVSWLESGNRTREIDEAELRGK